MHIATQGAFRRSVSLVEPDRCSIEGYSPKLTIELSAGKPEVVPFRTYSDLRYVEQTHIH